jgi:ankyrin repeat protein
VRERRPGLPVWAAANGWTAAVELLLDRGFAVDARGRGDLPIASTWETALHQAAAAGDVATARLLLGRGADPSARDDRFGATPADWARHHGHEDLARLLDAGPG